MTTTPVEELDDVAPREALIRELVKEGRVAARMMQKDSWGRPNPVWADQHEFLNLLLDFLEEAD